MNNMCIIYKITNSINNKVYVGQTWNTLEKRFNKHKEPTNKSCIKLFRAMNKYGRDKFKIEFITLCHTQEIANQLEIDFISKYNCIKNGYNIREGGSKGRQSESTKQKISKANTGQKRTEEFKKLNSERQIGRIISDATKKKISEKAKGRRHSEESKKKMSERAKGNQYAKKINNGTK